MELKLTVKNYDELEEEVKDLVDKFEFDVEIKVKEHEDDEEVEETESIELTEEERVELEAIEE